MPGTSRSKEGMGRSRLQGENLDVEVHKDSSLASTAVAEEIIELVKKTAAFGSFCLLGMLH